MLELRPLPQSHDLFVLWEIAKPLVSMGESCGEIRARVFIAQPDLNWFKTRRSCSGESFINQKKTTTLEISLI